MSTDFSLTEDRKTRGRVAHLDMFGRTVRDCMFE
jgi:hypothetical protein